MRDSEIAIQVLYALENYKISQKDDNSNYNNCNCN